MWRIQPELYWSDKEGTLRFHTELDGECQLALSAVAWVKGRTDAGSAILKDKAGLGMLGGSLEDGVVARHVG